MSVEIHGDKQSKDQELLVTYLAICNSTMLFCCKGETWYKVDSVSLLVDTPSIQNPRVADADSPPVGPYLLKGMSVTNVMQALAAVGARQLPVSGAWLAEMPRIGRWQRYVLEGHRDVELILNYGNTEAPSRDALRLILVEATTPKGQDGLAVRYKVECEMLDLNAPLKNRWHWAFGSAWAWKPGQADRTGRMKSAGQRR
ncbi:MAG: hypothetical protein NT154_00770 [Verrucomicrobia bacterium]|nr:hypothetical protein [Verrucomicrobiota bacterium]